jgi:hypothetical protein
MTPNSSSGVAPTSKNSDCTPSVSRLMGSHLSQSRMKKSPHPPHPCSGIRLSAVSPFTLRPPPMSPPCALSPTPSSIQSQSTKSCQSKACCLFSSPLKQPLLPHLPIYFLFLGFSKPLQSCPAGFCLSSFTLFSFSSQCLLRHYRRNCLPNLHFSIAFSAHS